MQKFILSFFIYTNFSLAQSITLGNDYSAFICDSGKIGVIGLNLGGRVTFSSFGELGVPKFVLGLSGISSISAGNERTFALNNEGFVYVWGQNYGCHGIGHDSSTTEIHQIPGLPKIKYIKSKDYNAFAIDSSNNLYAWGANGNGSLGIGNSSIQMSPVIVPGISNVAKIASSKEFTLALLTNGELMAWGENSYGQLGLGNYNSYLTPQFVQTLSGIMDIAVGESHSMALDSNGRVWTWGRNYLGQLGDTTFGFIEASPRLLSSLANISKIDASTNTSYAISSNGSVYSWGGDYSLLGHGQTSYVPIPTLIQSLANIVEIAVGWEHIVARSASSELYGWGATHFYELMDTTDSYWRSPRRVHFNCNEIAELKGFEGNQNEIVAYPNPCLNYFEIKLPEQNQFEKLDVFSLNGKHILTSYSSKVNFNLESGVYYVNVVMANSRNALRLVVVE